jgi:hypothetical protein
MRTRKSVQNAPRAAAEQQSPARILVQKKTLESQVPTAKTSGVTGYARRPSANTVKDDWPANMLQVAF